MNKMNNILATQLENIELDQLEPGIDTTLVAVETRPPDARITMDATRSHTFKVYHAAPFNFSRRAGIHSEDIQAHVARFQRFKLQQGRVKERGSITPQPEISYTCVNGACNETMQFTHFGARRARYKGELRCRCGAALVRGDIVKPYISDRVRDALVKYHEATDYSLPESPDPDVLPQVMCIFDATTVFNWVAETPLEQEAAARYGELGKTIVPYWVGGSSQAPMQGIVLLCRPLAVGWVDKRYFWHEDRRKEEEQNNPGPLWPGYTARLPRRQKPMKVALV